MDKCPNCNAPLEIKDPGKAKMKLCSHCGTQIDLDDQSYQRVQSYSQRPSPPKSALTLGLEGNINGLNYQVVGRIRYRDSYDYSWWDEWLLLSENGQYLWLQEDDWDFTLMHKFTPTQPVDPESVHEYLEIDGKRLEVEDKSEAIIQFFEGELTWKAKAGEALRYIDAWEGETTLYSIEWTQREIMFFIGRDILARDIYKAFNLGAPPAVAEEEDDFASPGFGGDTPIEGFSNKLMKGPMFIQTLLFGVMLIGFAIIFGFFGVNIPPKGSPQKVEPKYKIVRGRKVYAKGSTKRAGYIVGPYKLDKKGVYKIEAGAPGLSNRAQYVEFELLNEKKKPIAGFDADFWHESGYDSDGRWSESKKNKSIMFNLRDPGKYYIKVMRDPKSSARGNARITLKVKEGVFHTGPLWTLGIILLIYPGLVILGYIMGQSSEID